jgi:hypothetical protein
MCGFRRLNLGGVAVVVALVAGQGCAAVSYQDAKMVGKGNVEFTPTVTRVGVSEGGESEAVGTGFGGMIAAGVSEKVDFIAGYQRFEAKDSGGGANFAGLGPKFSLAKDKAALVLPVTFAFGNGADLGESLQVSPTAVFSVPLGTSVTFNPAAKVVWSNCEDFDVLVGASAGLSIPFASGKAVLRPDVGALKNPGESGLVWTFGLGLSLRSR